MDAPPAFTIAPSWDVAGYTRVVTDSGIWAPGEKIGDIEVLSQLGEGGMGAVFSAFDNRLKRRVALKVLRRRRRTHLDEGARERFLQEAQILSRLEHPGVCQIHDLLTVGDAEVLVLEEVPGSNLREAASDGLNREQILDIGLQLFDVLTAVHREGIVHRDLKAENVMLLPDGRVKVLDFGIARACELSDGEAAETEGEAREEPPYSPGPEYDGLTSAGVLVGTPRTMSPEQARGDAVGPASDVFTTGLLLQELLTGESPYDEDLTVGELLHKASWGDIRPPVGVTGELRAFLQRLTSPAEADRPSARDAGDQLRAILDAPRRRRRRVLVAATLLLLSFLAGGFGIQWRRAVHEAERARLSLEETREVSTFLEQLFQLSNPFLPEAEGEEQGAVTAEALLARGVENVRERFAEQPLARARFMHLLGGIEKNLSHLEVAAELADEVVVVRRAHLPAGHPSLGAALRLAGDVQVRLANHDQAEQLLTEALEIARGGESSDLDVADTLDQLAVLESERGHAKQAVSLLAEALEIRRRLQPANDPAIALTLQRLGSNCQFLNRVDDSREHFGGALAIVREVFGDEHPAVASLLNEIGKLDLSSGDESSAEARFREALRISRETVPATHPMHATIMTNLANVLEQNQRFVEAEPLYREAVAIKEASVGPDHPETAQVLINLATLKQNQGELEEAEGIFFRVIGIFEAKMGADHPVTGLALNNLAVLEQERREFAKAEDLYLRALGIFRARLSPDHPLCAVVLNNLGEVNRLRGQLEASRRYYQQSLSVGEQAFASDAPEMAEILQGAAETMDLLGEDEEAEELRRRAGEILGTAEFVN